MPSSNKITLLILPVLLGSSLLLSACNKNKETNPEQQPTQQHAQDELQTAPVKAFAATEQDAHDIALLDEFDEKFTAMSDDMENELAQMQQAGNLTPEFEQNRKLDHIQSALNMLKELDLKTAQGRYIQGMLYQYWESQGQLIQQHTVSGSSQNAAQAASTTQNLTDYLQAQKQLKHWKQQQKEAH